MPCCNFISKFIPNKDSSDSSLYTNISYKSTRSLNGKVTSIHLFKSPKQKLTLSCEIDGVKKEKILSDKQAQRICDLFYAAHKYSFMMSEDLSLRPFNFSNFFEQTDKFRSLVNRKFKENKVNANKFQVELNKLVNELYLA